MGTGRSPPLEKSATLTAEAVAEEPSSPTPKATR
jgi:hypothetical protein